MSRPDLEWVRLWAWGLPMTYVLRTTAAASSQNQPSPSATTGKRP